MKMPQRLFIYSVFSMMSVLNGCKPESRFEEKGFSISATEEQESTESGFKGDSLHMATQGGKLLLTGMAQFRLSPVFMVNTNKKTGETFVGSVEYRESYSEFEIGPHNAWHYHVVPGFDAAYGYNMVNAAVHDMTAKSKRMLFDKPVLLRTLYFPSYVTDTLNGVPIQRADYYVTAYDQDTDKDGRIGLKDLRRLFRFSADGTPAGMMLPSNCSVTESDYDPANDLMIVYARLDENNNGKIDSQEPACTYVVDLKKPENSGRLF